MRDARAVRAAFSRKSAHSSIVLSSRPSHDHPVFDVEFAALTMTKHTLSVYLDRSGDPTQCVRLAARNDVVKSCLP